MISLLVAMDKNRLIGKDNQLPWHLPADLAYFKKVTMGHPIIMGRKTFESIGRPLPGRTNIILTRNQNYEMEGCKVIHSIDDVKKMDEQMNEELFVIGGAEIFKEVLPFANRLYITQIEEVFEGDTFFPEINYNEWEEVSATQGVTDEKNPYTYAYHVYDRRK
ncbi:MULTISPECIES: dihydrofolate reductase [unclassified Bacillus (in: firmicutes)]|uniref:dihydrofolate reductase n=1 Tax=unclassified Bacillus (in: firmicutes) TaxID=185979 RepID=UPI0008E2F4D4|nr:MULTISPECIES: dihydrofolate reductase [unclassified Bacillus (in: firmicutes)]SFI01254.1 dihydrofolate reductase [Bacillus sp. 71mf]SFS92445.1 dihydrofolate reductase [Bacillus sp. 103mf]